MSIALGWLAVLAGFSGAPVPRVDGPEITYQFQLVEVNGLQWRGGAVTGLKPVTSRGGVTVWTAPRDFLKLLPAGTSTQVLMAPKVTTYSQAPAHITTRKNHPFVTQVAWRGEGTHPRETTENVREGMAATLSGRCIDQGVLTQVVIEETEVRAVHTLDLPDPARAHVAAASHEFVATPSLEYFVIGTALMPAAGCVTHNLSDSEMPNSAGVFCPAACREASSDPAVRQTSGQPGDTGACCADDKPNAAECHQATKTTAACESACAAKALASAAIRVARVQVPEIGRSDIAGEWLIPRDEVLLIGFGPHTVADKDGKAVVRERLAMITAEEIALPTVCPDSEPVGLPLPMPKVSRPAGGASVPLPTPPLPPRSMPQGVHADGTVADLPPLPEDEKAGQDANDSSEPRPSLQSRKPAKGETRDAKPAPRPAARTDGKASKAAFTLPMALFKQPALSQLAFPNLQFMMPLRPFAMRLPFNQKLEFELIGRVVADGDNEGSSDED